MKDCKATLLFARSLGGGGIAKLGARLRCGVARALRAPGTGHSGAICFMVLCGVHVSEPVI